MKKMYFLIAGMVLTSVGMGVAVVGVYVAQQDVDGDILVPISTASVALSVTGVVSTLAGGFLPND